MFIPTGKKYVATITRQVVREVTCEKCGTEYVYFARARATGTGRSPLFLDNYGARCRAGGEARMKVERQLRGLYLAVPCPECGWYQKYMVRILRFRRLRRWIAVVSAPLVWVGLKWCVSSSDPPDDLHLEFWIAVSAGLAVIATTFHLAWVDNLDPKSHIASDPTSGGIAMRKVDFEKRLAANADGQPTV